MSSTALHAVGAGLGAGLSAKLCFACRRQRKLCLRERPQAMRAHRQGPAMRQRANSVQPEGMPLFAAGGRRAPLPMCRIAARRAPTPAAKIGIAVLLIVRNPG